jgi:nucleoside-diphosphate-sugar epimerase
MIDGGATGDSLERPRAASATLVPEPDRGICDAMNKAIARAAGEFSMFPNADDCFGDAHAVADAVADMAKLAAIGWRARIGFRAGLAGSYRWYLDQPTPRH